MYSKFVFSSICAVLIGIGLMSTAAQGQNTRPLTRNGSGASGGFQQNFAPRSQPSSIPDRGMPQPRRRPLMGGGSSPGGFPTGNPSPMWDPNGVAGGASSSSTYWDPRRGWVTDTENTTELNSAFSPGRDVMPGTSIQTYRKWDGTRWVQGSRWLGRDGLWHGEHEETKFGPNGTDTNKTFYAPNPTANAGKPTSGITPRSGASTRSNSGARSSGPTTVRSRTGSVGSSPSSVNTAPRARSR